MSNLKIRDVRTIVTQPSANLIVVKIETDEPELYGLGCATFTQRALVVATAINDYLRPFLIGKDPAEIEDIWQSCNVSAYWRNGPILNNAISGVDQALWDIKGKVAGMPVYDLFGGKSREAAAVYVVPGGSDLKEYEENVWALIEDGFRHFKLGGADRHFAEDTPHSEKPIITEKVSESRGSIYDPAKQSVVLCVPLNISAPLLAGSSSSFTMSTRGFRLSLGLAWRKNLSRLGSFS